MQKTIANKIKTSLNYGIDYTRNESYECGMILLTILAYPEPNTDMQKENLHASLCHLYLRAEFEEEPEWRNTPQSIKPLYAFRTEKQVSKDLRQLQRRLRDRMIAARIAMPFLQEVNIGKLPVLPKPVARLSLNGMCSLVLDDAGHSDPENVETRIWRKSIPVIHLAAAVAILKDQLDKMSDKEVSIYDLVLNPSAVEWIISASQIYADMLVKSDRFKIKVDSLIEFSFIK